MTLSEKNAFDLVAAVSNKRLWNETTMIDEKHGIHYDHVGWLEKDTPTVSASKGRLDLEEIRLSLS
jgi:hypothetical protein